MRTTTAEVVRSWFEPWRVLAIESHEQNQPAEPRPRVELDIELPSYGHQMGRAAFVDDLPTGILARVDGLGLAVMPDVCG